MSTSSRQGAEEIAREVRAISDLPRVELFDRWISAHGSSPPKGISRRLLEVSAAYHVQVKRWGCAKSVVALNRRLSRLDRRSQGRPSGSSSQTRRKARLSAGTRLVREWNGRTYTVEVTSTGYSWNDRPWRSLSAIAKAITGARWSGPRFFGL